jgi:anti-sigma B factor antagonist
MLILLKASIPPPPKNASKNARNSIFSCSQRQIEFQDKRISKSDNINSGCEIMEINQTVINNIPVVAVSGRIDATTSRELEIALNDLIDQNRADIVLDLGGVEYISSVGLRVMLAALKKVRPKKGDVKLVSLQPFVREVFEITGFTKLFSIYPTQGEALICIKS